MLVRATRKLPDVVARGLILAALFIIVVVLQTALTSAFRAAGLNAGLSLALSGLAVLAVVLGVNWRLKRNRQLRIEALERARTRLGLPDGPCCVVWRTPDGAGEPGAEGPWRLDGAIRVAFPKAARLLGVEGLAVVEFEVGADGKAKHIACVEAWPSDVFYAAAAAGLREAQFTLMPGAQPRFGASYRAPFVFRIAGAARLREAGHRAKKRRPLMLAAQNAVGGAVERLRRRA